MFNGVQDYEHDTLIKRRQFLKEMSHQMLIEPFKRLADPVNNARQVKQSLYILDQSFSYILSKHVLTHDIYILCQLVSDEEINECINLGLWRILFCYSYMRVTAAFLLFHRQVVSKEVLT